MKETHPDVIRMMFGEKMAAAVELFKQDISKIVADNEEYFSTNTMVEEKKVFVFDFSTKEAIPNKELPDNIKEDIIAACKLRFKSI